MWQTLKPVEEDTAEADSEGQREREKVQKRVMLFKGYVLSFYSLYWENTFIEGLGVLGHGRQLILTKYPIFRDRWLHCINAQTLGNVNRYNC